MTTQSIMINRNTVSQNESKGAENILTVREFHIHLKIAGLKRNFIPHPKIAVMLLSVVSFISPPYAYKHALSY
jgi:hypothetical protein